MDEQEQRRQSGRRKDQALRAALRGEHDRGDERRSPHAISPRGGVYSDSSMAEPSGSGSTTDTTLSLSFSKLPPIPRLKAHLHTFPSLTSPPYNLTPSIRSSIRQTLYAILFGDSFEALHLYLDGPQRVPRFSIPISSTKTLLAAIKLESGSAEESLDPSQISQWAQEELDCKPTSERWNLATAQEEERVEKETRGERVKRRRGAICGRSLGRGERCYNCKTCATDSSCVLCPSCFFASDHTGHDVSYGIAFSFSGYCDCGDEEAWSGGVCGCKFHPSASGESATSAVAGLQPGGGVGNQHNSVSGLGSTSVTGFDLTAHSPLPNDLVGRPRGVSEDTEKRLRDVVNLVLDFLVETLRYAPAEVGVGDVLPRSVESLIEKLEESGLENATELKVKVKVPVKPTPPVTSSSSKSGKSKGKEPAVNGKGTENGSGDKEEEFVEVVSNMPFSLVLWADEKHTLKEIRRQLGDATGQQGTPKLDGWLKKLEFSGRVVIETSTDYPRLLHILHTLTQIDLSAQLRPAYDVYREEVCGILITWLGDLAESSICQDDLFLRRIIADGLFSAFDGIPPREEQMFMNFNMDGRLEKFEEISDMTRVDWLFVLFSRLWRSARVELMRVFVKIMTADARCRLGMGDHFAKVYHRLVDHYIFSDREPELSFILWGMQLFPIITIAESAVKNQDAYTKLLQILTSYFTEQHDNRRILLPPRHVRRIDADVQAFRTKKWQTISGHLRALLSSKGVQKLMRSQLSYLEDLCRFLGLFMGMIPQIRATGEHVEYESDSWIRALSVSMDLARITTAVGQGFAGGSLNNLADALRTVWGYIADATLLTPSSPLDTTKYKPLKAHSVLLFGREYDTFDFTVSEGYVSIHNPLHWLMAELLKHCSKLVTPEDMNVTSGLGYGKWPGWVIGRMALIAPWQNREEIHWPFLALMEYPLRTITYMAQVRAGMWVRNGIGMRGQLHHYREQHLREMTYDHDLIIVQLGLSVNPAGVLTAIIDKFGLADFFRGDAWKQDQDALHQSALVEELLLLLITLTSETWAILGKSKAELTRREVIHQLALGPLAYSDLTKRVSERTLDIPTFANILDDVAKLRLPQAVSETGVYELRPECFNEVNPLFYHYTRNQQGEAYELLVGKVKKANPVIGEDAMVWPKVDPRILDQSAPWGSISNVFAGTHIVEICFHAIHNAIRIQQIWPPGSSTKAVPQADGMLDLSLHLCLLAMVMKPVYTADTACCRTFGEDDVSLVKHLCEMEANKEAKTYRPRVKALLDEMAKHRPDEVREHRAVQTKKDNPAISGEDARKAAVKRRQDAILAGFAKNQQQFLDMYDDEDEEDDDMDEGVVSHGPCIVCQEECVPSRPSGLLANIQPSLAVRELPDERAWFADSLKVPTTLDDATREIKYGFGTTGEPTSTDAYPKQFHKFGLHTSACGHLMHEDCLAKFFRNTELRQSQQGQRNHPENAYRREFVCPLCKSVGNVLIPLDTPFDQLSKHQKPPVLPLTEWIRRVSEESLRDLRDPGRMWEQHMHSGEHLAWFANVVDIDYGDSAPGGILERFNSVISPMSAQTEHLHDRPETGLYMPESLVAYTVSMIEVTNRGMAAPQDSINGGLTDATLRLLKGLITLLKSYVDITEESVMGDPPARRVSLFARFLPEWFRISHLTDPLLLRDPFTMVIEAATIAPEILQPIIHLAYYAEFTRILLTVAFWTKRCSGEKSNRKISDYLVGEDDTSEDAQSIFAGIRPAALSMVRLRPHLHHETASSLSLLTDTQLSRLLYAYTLPFLRRCAIVQQVVYGTAQGASTAADSRAAGQSEYRRLLSFLSLPAPTPYLSDPACPLLITINTWIQDWANSKLSYLPPLEYPGIYELYRLPRSLEDFLKKMNKVKCEKCGKEPSHPTVCWICGEVVCQGTDCCAEGDLGECNLHRMTCGGAVGLFIDIKRWTTVYLYAGSGSYGPLPFLDCHGEVDQAMRRGHPQFQYQPRADELRRVWLTHGVPSFVARKLELTLDQGGWGSL